MFGSLVLSLVNNILKNIIFKIIILFVLLTFFLNLFFLVDARIICFKAFNILFSFMSNMYEYYVSNIFVKKSNNAEVVISLAKAAEASKKEDVDNS
jgi:hypothetical protein